MSKKLVLKSVLIALALVLTLSNLLSFSVSANTKELKQEEATEILNALSQSSVVMEDESVMINENDLENLIGENENYNEIVEALKQENMLTNKEANPIIAKAAANNINPKWENARDTCAKNYISNQIGSSAVDVIVDAILAGNFILAVKELGKRGFNLTVPGLIALYGKMNYTCIKEANSKYSVYL